MIDPICREEPDGHVSDAELREVLDQFVATRAASAKKVLLVPPDITRFHSRAGDISAYLYQALESKAEVFLMPALGTHEPMSEGEIRRMYGDAIPLDRFLAHDWRKDVVQFGVVESKRIAELSEGKVDFEMPVCSNRILRESGFDLIVSIGQVVPHEVIGMANYTKNLLVGLGGSETIHKSHFLGAVYGMERVMGRVSSPVRQALNEGFDRFLGDQPIEFILTVVGKREGKPALQGVYCGRGGELYERAALLSQRLNIELLDEPIDKAVVYLDPEEFKTTWLGDKAVYRLRMAIADGGQLIIQAPGLKKFGEDAQIDRLIRRHGYRKTEETLAAVESDPELANNLSAAAHLIHGSSEGRFSIVYCPGAGVTRKEVESVGYEYGDLETMQQRYAGDSMDDGWNTLPDGERVFYVSNPALGLWSVKDRFA